MKRLLLLSGSLLLANLLSSQAAFFFEPDPTDVTGPVRLYVDVSAPEIFDGCGNCNTEAFTDLDPETNPLYIWTWDPNGDRPDLNVGGETFNVTNGNWDLSNDNLVMTQDPDDPNLWYYDFLGAAPAIFYNVPASTFYDGGIFFLVKEKNGNPAAGTEGEQKSADINIIPEPVGCFEKICPFPTTFFQDEYFAITYDNNQETIQSLQNLGPDGALIWFRYRVNGGAIQVL